MAWGRGDAGRGLPAWASSLWTPWSRLWERGTETREDAARGSWEERAGQDFTFLPVSRSMTARVRGGSLLPPQAFLSLQLSTQRSESGQVRSHVSWALHKDARAAPDQALWKRQSRDQTRGSPTQCRRPPARTPSLPRSHAAQGRGPDPGPTEVQACARRTCLVSGQVLVQGRQMQKKLLFQSQRPLRGWVGTHGHLLSRHPRGGLRREEPAKNVPAKRSRLQQGVRERAVVPDAT